MDEGKEPNAAMTRLTNRNFVGSDPGEQGEAGEEDEEHRGGRRRRLLRSAAGTEEAASKRREKGSPRGERTDEHRPRSIV